jgi:hypothetical protein
MHPLFSEYSLDGGDTDKKHEAGFDAFMTGVLWFKLQSMINHPIRRSFPGIAPIL